MARLTSSQLRVQDLYGDGRCGLFGLVEESGPPTGEGPAPLHDTLGAAKEVGAAKLLSGFPDAFKADFVMERDNALKYTMLSTLR